MDKDKDGIRIDKWLWSVRLFKTRVKAQMACKNGNISIDGKNCKPSKTLLTGNKIVIRSGSEIKEILVKGLISKRVSAKIAIDLYEIN